MTRLLGATKIDKPMTKKETGFIFFFERDRFLREKKCQSQRPQQLISVFTWGRIFEDTYGAYVRSTLTRRTQERVVSQKFFFVPRHARAITHLYTYIQVLHIYIHIEHVYTDQND